MGEMIRHLRLGFVRRSLLALIIPALLLSTSAPDEAHAWCWLRQAGDVPCASGGWQTACCTSPLRTYPANGMTYYSSPTMTAIELADLTAAALTWNNVEMSSFTFVDGGLTTDVGATDDFDLSDGFSVVKMDPLFCTNPNPALPPDPCGSGVIGISATVDGVTDRVTGAPVPYQAFESDILLNNDPSAGFIWGDGTGGTLSRKAVLIHELGHDMGLGHAGSTCRQAASAGCGPEFPGATMYFSYTSNLSSSPDTLELDDAAAAVYGYPLATMAVSVVDTLGAPVPNAEVILQGTAAPINGTGIADGGQVGGDLSQAVLVGDKLPSPTYNATANPFTPTDAAGMTNSISPLNRSFSVVVRRSGAVSVQPVTLIDGANIVPVVLDLTTAGDLIPPEVLTWSPMVAELPSLESGLVFTVTFNEDMNPSSINPSTIFLTGGITSQVTYDAATRTATMVTQSALTQGFIYTFNVSAQVQDAFFNPMGQAFQVNYGTGDLPPPTINNSSSGGGGGCLIEELCDEAVE